MSQLLKNMRVFQCENRYSFRDTASRTEEVSCMDAFVFFFFELVLQKFLLQNFIGRIDTFSVFY